MDKDIELIQKIIKNKFNKTLKGLCFSKPKYSDSELDIPDSIEVFKDNPQWFQVVREHDRCGLELYQKVRVISHNDKSLLGKDMYVVGWIRTKRGIRILLNFDTSTLCMYGCEFEQLEV